MTRVLLDTHAFLWFVFDDPRLSPRAAELIAADTPRKSLSMVSIWEMVIKQQIGKLSLGVEWGVFVDREIRQADLDVLPVELEHIQAYSRLPLHHRDPFDRMIAAQAIAAGTALVTSDRKFEAYDCETIWD